MVVEWVNPDCPPWRAYYEPSLLQESAGRLRGGRGATGHPTWGPETHMFRLLLLVFGQQDAADEKHHGELGPAPFEHRQVAHDVRRVGVGGIQGDGAVGAR